MPGSYPHGKTEIVELIKSKIPFESKILDVGPGYGIYGKMLNVDYKIDAVEIFERYISDYSLSNIYNKIYVCEICDFNFSEYDLLIMGDVLEHIDTNRANDLIEKINKLNKKVVVAVPYNYHQGSWEGNIYETHLQYDLTIDVMNKRYPSLTLVLDYSPIYGYYTNF